MEVEINSEVVTSAYSSPDAISSNQNLQQFLLLAKSTHGAALKALVQQVLESTDIFVFGELLECVNIQEMSTDPDGAKYLKLLNVFSYGTYKDYMNQSAVLPVLTPAMAQKLRLLTVISLASKSKYIHYDTLLEEVNLSNVRDLENLLISAIYADIVHGRLDQQNSRLEVDWTIGRDLTDDDMTYMVDTLESWCSRCKTMLQSIGTQMLSANTFLKEDEVKKVAIKTEVENIMSTIKKTSSQDLEFQMAESRHTQHLAPSSGVEVKPKKSKVKGLRGSGMKLWSSKN